MSAAAAIAARPTRHINLTKLRGVMMGEGVEEWAGELAAWSIYELARRRSEVGVSFSRSSKEGMKE